MSPAIQALMDKAKNDGAILKNKLVDLELSNWNEHHESQLKQYYGYNDKTLAKRKKELIKHQNESKTKLA